MKCACCGKNDISDYAYDVLGIDECPACIDADFPPEDDDYPQEDFDDFSTFDDFDDVDV